jgi:hypothetical protein
MEKLPVCVTDVIDAGMLQLARDVPVALDEYARAQDPAIVDRLLYSALQAMLRANDAFGMASLDAADQVRSA